MKKTMQTVDAMREDIDTISVSKPWRSTRDVPLSDANLSTKAGTPLCRDLAQVALSHDLTLPETVRLRRLLKQYGVPERHLNHGSEYLGFLLTSSAALPQRVPNEEAHATFVELSVGFIDYLRSDPPIA